MQLVSSLHHSKTKKKQTKKNQKTEYNYAHVCINRYLRPLKPKKSFIALFPSSPPALLHPPQDDKDRLESVFNFSVTWETTLLNLQFSFIGLSSKQGLCKKHKQTWATKSQSCILELLGDPE